MKTDVLKYYALTTMLALTFFVSATAAAAESSKSYFIPLQQMLIRDGFDSAAINSLYAHPDVTYDMTNISSFFAHRESRLNYDQFATRKSINKARKYMKVYEADLNRAEKTYGVDREIITAIILVETQLGTMVGRSPVLNTLSSLASLLDGAVRDRVWNEISNPINLSRDDFNAWADRKSKWAYAELKSFLEYTRNENINPVDINGSIAGAMGISQFMPSNIIAYARDGNADGRVDLFNHADAIASVASYLKHYGWRPGIDSKKAYKVVYYYNHSKYYVNTILKIAKRLKN